MMSGGVRESLLSGLECEKHATIVLDHARVRMWVIHGVLDRAHRAQSSSRTLTLRQYDSMLRCPFSADLPIRTLCLPAHRRLSWCAIRAA